MAPPSARWRRRNMIKSGKHVPLGPILEPESCQAAPHWLAINWKTNGDLWRSMVQLFSGGCELAPLAGAAAPGGSICFSAIEAALAANTRARKEAIFDYLVTIDFPLLKSKRTQLLASNDNQQQRRRTAAKFVACGIGTIALLQRQLLVVPLREHWVSKCIEVNKCEMIYMTRRGSARSRR